jgi:hypothetical protein
MNKRGSHVGIVLSFVIFIVFLVFLYAILQPRINVEKEKQSTLDNLKPIFLDYITEELIILTVFNKTSHSSYDCLEIDKGISGISGLNCSVRNESGEIVNFSSLGSSLRINWKDEEFFKLYCSSEKFQNRSFNSATGCVSGVIESSLIKDYIFQTKIHSLKREYDNEYESLKIKLGIPKSDDFGFIFEYVNGTEIGTIEKEISRSIYSKDVPVYYIDEEAQIKKGNIKINIW